MIWTREYEKYYGLMYDVQYLNQPLKFERDFRSNFNSKNGSGFRILDSGSMKKTSPLIINLFIILLFINIYINYILLIILILWDKENSNANKE